MLFVVIMGTVWSVVISTDDGVRNAPSIHSRAARTMGADGLDRWINVVLPASPPFIVGGVKQGCAFAWRSLMAAEIYVTMLTLTGFGLGNLLYCGRELHAVDRVIVSDAHHRPHPAAGRENPVLAVGTLSPPALGNGAGLTRMTHLPNPNPYPKPPC